MHKKRIVVLVGPMCSGKSRLEKELVTKGGYEKIVPLTTRTIRPGEKSGEDYTYVKPSKFIEIRDQGLLMESACFQTSHSGLCFYGTYKKDYELNNHKQRKVVILNPATLITLADTEEKLFMVRLYLNKKVQIERATKRGDHVAEIERRVYDDRALFSKADKWVGEYDLLLHADDTIKTLYSKIIKAHEAYLKGKGA